MLDAMKEDACDEPFRAPLFVQISVLIHKQLLTDKTLQSLIPPRLWSFGIEEVDTNGTSTHLTATTLMDFSSFPRIFEGDGFSVQRICIE